MKKYSIIIIILLWIWAFCPYILFPKWVLFTVSSLLLISWIALAIPIIKRKLKWKAYFLLSPIIVLFAYGTINAAKNYVVGKATFFYHSETSLIPLDSYQDFDHTYRVYYKDFRGKHYGAFNLITNSELCTGFWNDWTIKLLVKLFGYQRQMYKGKIPNPDQIMHLLKKERLDTIFADNANVDDIEFIYQNKSYNIRNATNIKSKNEPPIECIGGLEDERIDNGDGTYKIGGKKFINGSYFLATNHFYPLLLIVLNINQMSYENCVEIQLVDLENQIMFTHYSIKDRKSYNNEFCGE